MNQTQRKYALQQIETLSSQKQTALQQAFFNRPENKQMPVPSARNPYRKDIIRQLYGENVGIELKSKEEAIRGAGSDNGHMYGFESVFAHPVNRKDIDHAMAHNQSISQRSSTVLVPAQESIRVEARRLQNMIMLGSNIEAQGALAEFERFQPNIG